MAPINTILEKSVKQLGFLRRSLGRYDLEHVVSHIREAQNLLLHSEVYIRKVTISIEEVAPRGDGMRIARHREMLSFSSRI